MQTPPSPHPAVGPTGPFTYCATESSDAAQHSRAMTGWDHAYQPIGRVPYRARIAELQLGPIQLALEQIDTPMRYQGGTRRGYAVFSSLLPTHGTTVCGGRPLAPNTIVKFPNGCSHSAYGNGPIGFVTVAVAEDWFLDHAAQASGGALSRRIVQDGFCVVDVDLVLRFQQHVTALLRECRDIARPDDARWRTRAGEALRRLLVEVMQAGHTTGRHLPPPSTRAYVVDQAVAYMDEHLTDPVPMSSIADEVRVSPRTLRYSFEDITGVSPHDYLLALRLQRVRAELRAAGASRSIQRVAEEYGFGHLGRFARYYRAAFGELPSATARASRDAAAAFGCPEGRIASAR